ncbi:hypothetical protein [Streptomyces sp. NPDC016845]|uniref:hypothetical protein n=1 Tax=Streptomyces sp. NPDC016845 TaxID=3364972 RepID=UPI0037B68355
MAAFAELPEQAAAELESRLHDIFELGQMMAVTADESDLAEQVVATALDKRGGMNLVRVTARAPAHRTAVIDALWAALFPGRWHGARPRILSEAERDIDAELDRRTRPVLLVGDAQQLRGGGWQCLYGTWRAAADRYRPLPLIWTGTTRLTTVLQRPALDSIDNRIYLRYRIEPAHGQRRPAR